MATDWQVGDLAVCVSDENAPMLSVGRMYRVRRIIPNGKRYDGKLDLGLALCEIINEPPYKGFWHGLFTKIRPDEHEACEEEFVTLLNRKSVEVSNADG